MKKFAEFSTSDFQREIAKGKVSCCFQLRGVQIVAFWICFYQRLYQSLQNISFVI